MSRYQSHRRPFHSSIAFALGALLALLAGALAAVPASAAYPYIGAPIVYVGLQDRVVPEEGIVGVEPVGLRSIRLGQPRSAARVLTDDSISAPAVSPDGRWIAFSLSGSIALMRTDGSGMRRVTVRGADSADREPSFSPSGNRIVFVRHDDETFPGGNEGDVYSVRTDGGGLRQITSGGAADRSPAISPNGRQIVFGRTPVGKGFQRLYSVRPDSSDMRNLTPRIPARRRPGERHFSAEDPAFSPNGRTIAFTVSAGSGAENIYTMHPSGNRLRSLTGVGERPLSRRFKLSEPAFSPSGHFLLVTARDPGHTELAVIDLADRSDLLGTGGTIQGEAAAWIPPPR